MNKYTIYCTEAQAKKAIELGAPITHQMFTHEPLFIPTAEQMIGWIREQGLAFDTEWSWGEKVTVCVWDNHKKELVYVYVGDCLKECTLVAIDEALDYLAKIMEEKL